MHNFFDDDFTDEHDAQIAAYEKAALTAIRAIARIADTHPAKALNVGATLRKISTAAGSKAQGISLRSVKLKEWRQA